MPPTSADSVLVRPQDLFKKAPDPQDTGGISSYDFNSEGTPTAPAINYSQYFTCHSINPCQPWIGNEASTMVVDLHHTGTPDAARTRVSTSATPIEPSYVRHMAELIQFDEEENMIALSNEIDDNVVEGGNRYS